MDFDIGLGVIRFTPILAFPHQGGRYKMNGNFARPYFGRLTMNDLVYSSLYGSVSGNFGAMPSMR